MPFDPVRVQMPDEQEYGPVSWAEAIQWSEQGRIPLDATIIDHGSGERVLASTFAVFARNAEPHNARDLSTPPPLAECPSVSTSTTENSGVFLTFFQTYIGPVIRKRLERMGFRLTAQGYRDVIASLGQAAHAQLSAQQRLTAFEQRINDVTQRQSAIDFLVKSLGTTTVDAFILVVQSATPATEILALPGQKVTDISVTLEVATPAPVMSTVMKAVSQQNGTHPISKKSMIAAVAGAAIIIVLCVLLFGGPYARWSAQHTVMSYLTAAGKLNSTATERYLYDANEFKGVEGLLNRKLDMTYECHYYTEQGWTLSMAKTKITRVLLDKHIVSTATVDVDMVYQGGPREDPTYMGIKRSFYLQRKRGAWKITGFDPHAQINPIPLLDY